MPAFKDVVSELAPKERVWSFSYSRFCLNFCKDLSYRRAADMINTTLHRSAENSIKVRTLVDFTERVGDNIQNYLAAVSETVLKDHDFELGTASTVGESPIPDMAVKPDPTVEQKLWEAEIVKKAEEINAQRESREQIGDLENL